MSDATSPYQTTLLLPPDLGASPSRCRAYRRRGGRADSGLLAVGGDLTDADLAVVVMVVGSGLPVPMGLYVLSVVEDAERRRLRMEG